MKLKIFALCTVSCLFLSGRNIIARDHQKTDSLLTALHNARHDTARLSIYASLSWHYTQNPFNLARARKYTDSLKALSTALHHRQGKAIALLRYGNIERLEGNYEQALTYLDSLALAATQLGDSSLKADGFFQAGSANRLLGNYEKGLSCYYRVLAIGEWAHNKTMVGNALRSIGIIYIHLKQYDKAIDNFQKSLHIFDSLGNKSRVASCLNTLGNAYAEKKEFELARDYFQQGLNISRELGNQRNVSYHLANLGNLYNKMGSYDLALSNHLQSLKIRQQLTQKKEIAESMRDVGYTYLKTRDFVAGENYLKQSLEIAWEIKSKPLVRDLYLSLSELYAAKKDFPNAYNFQKKYVKVKDSILNEESREQINRLEARYQTARKNEQIATLSKKQEIQQIQVERQAAREKALAVGLILLVIIGGLFLYLLWQRLKNQKVIATKNDEIKTAHFKRQLSELRLKSLRAQMNPHFIFNCMNSINRMILSGDADNASRYLTKFARLIRLILENSEKPTVTLEDESAMVESYIQLESLTCDGKISYDFHVDDTIDKESTYLPSMVLQPFIENAIWHGLMHKHGKGSIKISIRQEDDLLKCCIEDNGVGREKALELKEKTVLKGKSMGLQITEERLKLMSKGGLKELISITDLKDSLNRALGTRVDILIPIA